MVSATLRQTEPKEIPHPPTYPLVGNLPQLDHNLPLNTVVKFAKEYGPIYRFTTPTGSIVIVSNQELVHAVSDDALFAKHIPPVLEQIRTFAGDGLFTAYGHEHNWALAHRILVPAFGPLAVKKMQGKMMAILTEFLLFTEHHAGQPFEAADLYTRLTFVSPQERYLKLTGIRIPSGAVLSTTDSTPSIPPSCIRSSRPWSAYSLHVRLEVECRIW